MKHWIRITRVTYVKNSQRQEAERWSSGPGATGRAASRVGGQAGKAKSWGGDGVSAARLCGGAEHRRIIPSKHVLQTAGPSAPVWMKSPHLINLLTIDTLNPSTRYVNISFWNGLKMEGCSRWIFSSEVSVWETEVLLWVAFSGVLKMSTISGLKSELQKE